MTEAAVDKSAQTTGVHAIASHSRFILAVIVAATFLDVVDFSVVQVALPTIQREFAASLPDLQWVTGIYGLTLAGFLLVSGRSGDVYGQKRIFVLGIAIFTASSLTAGFAPSLLVLIASRGIQGVAAAMTTATALAILASTFPEGKERNRAIGILVAVLSAGFAAGAILGGVLTAAFGWRSVMFVNVPIGVAAVLLALRFIAAEPGRASSMRLDVPGALAVTTQLILLVYGLTRAAEVGLFTVDLRDPFGFLLSPVILLAISLIALALFVVIERRSGSPLVPLSFVRRRTILSANVLSVLFGATAGGIIILTIYMQQTLGYSALQAGLAFLPAAMIFFFVGGWVSSWLVNRVGLRRVLVASTILITVGSALFAPLPVSAGYLGILPGTIFWSLGASLGFPALAIAGLAGAKHGEEGLASGLIQTSQRLGFPLGLAVLLTIAAAVDPELGLDGWRYGLLGAAVLGALALVIAVVIPGEQHSRIEPEVVTAVAQVQSGRREG